MKELVFDIIQEANGGFCAAARGEGIFTQGDTLDELRANVKDAVEGHFYDSPSQSRSVYISSTTSFPRSLKDAANIYGTDLAKIPLQALGLSPKPLHRQTHHA